MKKNLALLFILGTLLSSCDFLFFWEDDQEDLKASSEDADSDKDDKADKSDSSSSKNGAKSVAAAAKEAAANGDDEKAPKDPMAMRMAKLQLIVEKLEDEVRRQREDFHVLRKGLMTGLIPSDWRDDIPKYSRMGEQPSEKEPRSRNDDSLSVILGKGEGSGGKGFEGLTDDDRRRYEKKLADANHYFRASDYGKAIAAYERIGEEYSDKITKGNHLLWIGAGWFRLHDFQLSKKALTKLLKSYQASPWAPEAEFMLAKIDFSEGMIEKSVEGFKDIVKKHPNENVADRAREELRRIEENL